MGESDRDKVRGGEREREERRERERSIIKLINTYTDCLSEEAKSCCSRDRVPCL